MKVCKQVFEHAYICQDGEVRLCGWNTIPVGNVLENTIEEIWKTDKVKELKEAFMRGERPSCKEEYCPHCLDEKFEESQQDKKIFDFSEDEIQEMYEEGKDYPLEFNLAFDYRCNHICPSCRYEYLEVDQQYKDNMKKIINNLKHTLTKVKKISTNGSGELFVCKELMEMLQNLKPKRDDFSLDIESNGVLFNEMNWKKIEHLNVEGVGITPNSFDRETYRYLAGRDDMDKVIENLYFLKKLRKERKIKRLVITMVVQSSNFREMPSFVERCLQDFEADNVVLRPIFKWFSLSDDDYFIKSVLNPNHPYHKEYLEILDAPILSDPRILHWGTRDKVEPFEHPCKSSALKFQNYYEIMSKLLLVEDLGTKTMKYFENPKVKKVGIYGFGNIGKSILNLLTKTGIHVICVFDNWVCDNNFNGIPIVNPSIEIIEKLDIDIIIVSATFDFVNIENDLIEKGCKAKIVAADKWMDEIEGQ